MFPLLALLALGAVGAGVALSRKQVPATVGASMQDMLNKYTHAGPSGERVFNPDVALAIVRTLSSQLFTYVDQKDPTRITIKPSPAGAPPSADLSAQGWAQRQNESLTIMAPVYMAESSSAQRFLSAVAPGQEQNQPQLYAVVMYAGGFKANAAPPGTKPAPGATPTPAVKTDTQQAANQEIPADLLTQYQTLLTSGTDPNQMLFVATELDAVGLHSSAELLRKQAASLQAVQAGPPGPGSGFPGLPGGFDQYGPPGPGIKTGPAGGPAVLPGSTLASRGPNSWLPADLYSALAGADPSSPQGVAALIALGKSRAGGVPQIIADIQSAAGKLGVSFPGDSSVPVFVAQAQAAVSALQAALQQAAAAAPGGALYPGGPAGGLSGTAYQQWAQAHPDQVSTLISMGLLPQGFTLPGTTPGGGAAATPSGGAPAVTPVALTSKQSAAVAMNSALGAHGYKQTDQPIYKAYQSAAGLSPVDGFPGRGTMNNLQATLSGMGVQMAPVKTYPWSSAPSAGGYNGVNAPTSAEWYGTSAVSPAPSQPSAPSVVTTPAGVPGVVQAAYAPAGAPPGSTPLQIAAVNMNNALSAHGYKQYDQNLYKAFQSAAGTPVDGFPGTGSMGKLQSVVTGMGLSLAPVPVYPWHSYTYLHLSNPQAAYDGKNAPLWSDWTAPAGATTSVAA